MSCPGLTRVEVCLPALTLAYLPSGKRARPRKRLHARPPSRTPVCRLPEYRRQPSRSSLACVPPYLRTLLSVACFFARGTDSSSPPPQCTPAEGMRRRGAGRPAWWAVGQRTRTDGRDGRLPYPCRAMQPPGSSTHERGVCSGAPRRPRRAGRGGEPRESSVARREGSMVHGRPTPGARRGQVGVHGPRVTSV